MPETLRQTYFRPLDNQRDWQIDQSLRARVAFAQLNLMELDKNLFMKWILFLSKCADLLSSFS